MTTHMVSWERATGSSPGEAACNDQAAAIQVAEALRLAKVGIRCEVWEADEPPRNPDAIWAEWLRSVEEREQRAAGLGEAVA